jgi:hypothetical protein
MKDDREDERRYIVSVPTHIPPQPSGATVNIAGTILFCAVLFRPVHYGGMDHFHKDPNNLILMIFQYRLSISTGLSVEDLFYFFLQNEVQFRKK